MSTDPSVSLNDFKHWLNDRRALDVSMVFHEIVDKFAAFTTMQPSCPSDWPKLRSSLAFAFIGFHGRPEHEATLDAAERLLDSITAPNGPLPQLRTMAQKESHSELDGWISFSEKEPPISAALDNPNIKTTDTVLVTNNTNARNRMGKMSHKWLAIPLKNSDGSWTAFDDADRCISDLTHWKYA